MGITQKGTRVRMDIAAGMISIMGVEMGYIVHDYRIVSLRE